MSPPRAGARHDGLVQLALEPIESAGHGLFEAGVTELDVRPAAVYHRPRDSVALCMPVERAAEIAGVLRGESVNHGHYVADPPLDQSSMMRSFSDGRFRGCFFNPLAS
jgi:hypothetical protein